MTTARIRKHMEKRADLQATLEAIWELVEQADAGIVAVGGVVATSDLRRVLRGESHEG